MAIKTRQQAQETLVNIERLAGEVREWVLDQYEEARGSRRQQLLGLSNDCLSLAASMRHWRDVLEPDEEEDRLEP